MFPSQVGHCQRKFGVRARKTYILSMRNVVARGHKRLSNKMTNRMGSFVKTFCPLKRAKDDRKSGMLMLLEYMMIILKPRKKTTKTMKLEKCICLFSETSQGRWLTIPLWLTECAQAKRSKCKEHESE